MDERTEGAPAVRPGREGINRGGGRVSRWRSVGLLGLLGLLMVVLQLAASETRAADESPQQVSWSHPNAALVERFIVYVSPEAGNLERARRLDVGLPAATPIGSTTLYSIILPLASNEYVAVRAVGVSGRTSEPSNWRAQPPSRPGQPFPVQP